MPTTPTRRGGRTSDAGNATQKALRILEASVTGGGRRRLADIAETAAIPKPSVHRVLGILVGEGFLTTEAGGWYGPGPRLRALAAQVPTTSTNQLADVLRDLRQRVEQTVHLAVRSGDEATYIEKVDADQPYQMRSAVGMRVPLHCTAIGKCLLAHQQRPDVDDLVQRSGLARRTPRTITGKRALHAELATVRSRGYAVDDEENEATVRCIAVPVLDASGAAVAAVSVSTLTFLVTAEELQTYLPALRDAATALSQVLTAAG